MEFTEEQKSILFVALSNSTRFYMQALEDGEKQGLTQEELNLTNYIIQEHQALMDIFEKELGADTPIPTPPW